MVQDSRNLYHSINEGLMSSVDQPNIYITSNISTRYNVDIWWYGWISQLGVLCGRLTNEVQYSQRHNVINHCDRCLFVYLMMFNATFNNILVISWRSILLVEETGRSRENHLHVASYWQTWSHNVVHLALIKIWTNNNSGDRHWLHRYM